MRIGAIIGTIIVLLSGIWLFLSLPGYSYQTLYIIIWFIIAIPILIYLWMR